MAEAMQRLTSRLSPVLIALMLSGCAADRNIYPSLARRDAERITGTAEVVPAEPAPPTPPSPPSPDLTSRLAALSAQANSAHQRFIARESDARRLSATAQGSAVASEPWSVAAVALADLESARSDAMIALADLDALYTAERITGGETGAIAAARDEVTALVGTEDRILAELYGRLSS